MDKMDPGQDTPLGLLEPPEPMVTTAPASLQDATGGADIPLEFIPHVGEGTPEQQQGGTTDPQNPAESSLEPQQGFSPLDDQGQGQTMHAQLPADVGVCQEVPVPPESVPQLLGLGAGADIPLEFIPHVGEGTPEQQQGGTTDPQNPAESSLEPQQGFSPLDDQGQGQTMHAQLPADVGVCQEVPVPPESVPQLLGLGAGEMHTGRPNVDFPLPVQGQEPRPSWRKGSGRQQQYFPPLWQPQISVDRMEERMRIGQSASTFGHRQEGQLLARCEKEFAEEEENYLRGCKWSADGSMLMTNSNDNVIRVFHMPGDVLGNKWDVNTELTSSVKIRELDLVYDFAWHPCMTSTDPTSCVLVTTVRQTPIHMFSAVSGQHVASYRPYNHLDEIEAAHSVGFTSDGRHLMAGFNRKLRCFDVSRPGRDCVRVSTVSVKDRITHQVEGQRGILSCFAAHPTNHRLIAAGAFNGDVAIYEASSCSMTTLFAGQTGGITHVTFSKDGNYLFAGGRKDPEINCFDIRNPEKILYVLYRHVATNQRIYFDINSDSQYLLSGHHSGHVSAWDLKGERRANDLVPWPRLDPVSHFAAHNDTVNGLHIHPYLPILATCSGQRHFPESIFRDSDDSPLDRPEPDVEENSLKLWRLRLP